MEFENDDFDPLDDYDFEADDESGDDLPFAEVLAALLTAEEVSVPLLYRLSDTSEEDRSRLFEAWLLTPDERRREITRHLADLSEDNFLVDFSPVLAFGLADPDARVREAALDGLWDATDLALIDPIINLLHTDPAEQVRANAAATLAHYLLMSAWGELRGVPTEQIIEALLAAYERPSAGLLERRAALEALGSVNTQVVRALIEAAYEGDVPELQQAALFAMGNSADPRWLPTVLDEMESPIPEMRFEAARASGHIGHSDAVPALSELVYDEEEQVAAASIVALSMIGGTPARRVLEGLAEEYSDDEEMLNLIEVALEEIEWIDSDLSLLALGDDLLDVDEEDDELIDLDDLDE